jgi:chromosome segregation ATPase
MSEKISDVSLTVDEHPRYIALKSEFDSLAKAHEITLKDNKSTHDRLAEVKAELETVKASVVTTAKANDDEEAMAGLKSKLDEKEKEVASLRESIASLESSKASVEAEKSELATANDAMQATINEFKKASRHSDRAEALMKVDSTLTRENALQTVAKFDELSDSGFAAMIEVTKGFAARSPKEVTPESILATAKVEASPPLGAAAEDKFDKITADVKNFLTNKKGA